MEEKSVDERVKEGDINFEEKAYFLALNCYDAALEIEPTNATIWAKKGAVFTKSYRLVQAISCFDKAIELDPELGYAKEARKKARNKFSSIYGEDLKNSGFYIFIGILLILGSITSLILFYVELGYGPAFWGTLINTFISIIIGFVWIGITKRFRILSDYMKINKSSD